jgi:hypothetical protein
MEPPLACPEKAAFPWIYCRRSGDSLKLSAGWVGGKWAQLSAWAYHRTANRNSDIGRLENPKDTGMMRSKIPWRVVL